MTDVLDLMRELSAAEHEIDRLKAAVDIAWAAGLFEGEGSIQLWQDTKSERSYPRLELSSTDQDVVLRFAGILGGAIYGPIERENRKPFWRWTATGERARSALAVLAPQLGARRTARMDDVLARADVPTTNRKESH